MLEHTDGKLTRIGVFYDGGYFAAVSDYYRYCHQRKARVSISGLHEFLKHKVAEVESVEERYCQIVDAHYFRGRFSADESNQKGKLLDERKFDDILMKAGVITHYLPRAPQGEKGIDVWFALEAFELAIYKRFTVLVLVACDGDYLPLIRKLNTLGTRVMLLSWDFDETDPSGRRHSTRTSQLLLDEVTYPVPMHTLIDDRAHRNDTLIENLFISVPQRTPTPPPLPPSDHGPAAVESADAEPRRGTIHNLVPDRGFGFITDDSAPGNQWFFHRSDLVGMELSDLRPGDPVEFRLGEGEKGPKAVDVRRP
ncbi:MAG: cold-shock protein [Armatimonadetes bacterium CG_4_10_14_3_um_filter_66_18]|nr:MAG: cold-shock protein [Armatimonadetes bacterium CG_4_8_14_3_um_filter_66_20]PIY35649.1 MAG: cold-shock protein [Armatimonadetes bacterium CG_4_10_14_3_um_filter_66_18]